MEIRNAVHCDSQNESQQIYKCSFSVINKIFALIVFSTLCFHSAYAEPPTFEEFKETLSQDQFGSYILEGDIPVNDEETLYQYYQRFILNVITAELIIHTENGVDAKWDDQQKLNLTYCVSTSFGTDYLSIIETMHQATSDWEKHAQIDFIHLQEQDAYCDEYNQEVLFDVSPTSDTSYLSRAFFPGFSRQLRNILISDSALVPLSDGLTLEGVLRHELGHVLGFRHEHTRSEAQAPQCFEDNNWRVITDYDSSSVMHYPQCNGTGGMALTITALDAVGVSEIYGSKLSDGDDNSWVSGVYENNANIEESLQIVGAEYLEVALIGVTEENFDFFYLEDEAGNVLTFHGQFNASFIVMGSSVTLRLISDGSVVKSGVSVLINERTLGDEFIVMGGDGASACPADYQIVSVDQLSAMTEGDKDSLIELLGEGTFRLDSTWALSIENNDYQVLESLVAERFTLCSLVNGSGDPDENGDPPSEDNTAVWQISEYGNNANINQVLSLDDAEKLIVTVRGVTELNVDQLIILDQAQNKYLFSGDFDKSFEVDGASIQIQFLSDATSVIGGGIEVIIEELFAAGDEPPVNDPPSDPPAEVLEWTSGTYENNSDITEILTKPGASSLEVTVSGATEINFDYLTIIDANNESRVFHGDIHETFVVNGSSITIRFQSDSSIVASGVTVSIQ